ncbi:MULTISPECIES: SDR family NAD(P)-dependent oxidoreductase [unclassified Sphingobium]|uniref:SDR family NAD(P)-dependent oxidoreductase n=1 Tax=unclassified Sphingobium TaxID=2611147 RepID=UPI000D1699CB|nr:MULTISPECIES: SDR family NAD(P)-dependent oxidoreductase [unclassified Sphingobium]MBG6120109.1 NAD(P)-dependent dehydrogenase (short-subunit alcohol dehydrogenase family) [Sphingobium sp. JAI105]PSO12847.1 hypothetical protein C7E20_03570 [Sphingobium sp. AEW4]TWD05690.1 short-subunit dehydrogenase [Sphingobium sp. AEW010]TWD23243.1 short-subunit dehydrogenase [Sphingobium sp. AEW013]TWD25103.1 short-subunit dehydrogenase [Sphingobium sp. AEW001]
MLKGLDGRNAVVTGGASGIGFALARAILLGGGAVALVDLPGERLDDAARRLGEIGRIVAYGVDVADTDAMLLLGTHVRTEFGAVQLLCNNAGIAGVHRWFWNFRPEEWQRMIDVNLRGVINGLQAFLPAMIDQPEGHVLNTASMAGLIPTPMNGPYCAAKFGIVGLSEALALDLASHGSAVGVSVLCPGLVSTAIGDGHQGDGPTTLDARERSYCDKVDAGLASGMDADEAARITLDAIRAGRFHILTHPAAMKQVDRRFQAIQRGEAPPPPH